MVLAKPVILLLSQLLHGKIVLQIIVTNNKNYSKMVPVKTAHPMKEAKEMERNVVQIVVLQEK